MVLTRFPEVVIAAVQGRAGEGGRVSFISFEDAEFEVPLATVRNINLCSIVLYQLPSFRC